MKCYKCRREIPEDVKFCPECGSEQGFSEELIKKAIDGEQASITELYNRTYNNAYFTVKSMIKDEDTALDIIQDSYVKAFKNLGQLQDPNKFRAWIKRICHNQAVDYLRKAKPVMFSSLTTEDNEVIEFEDDRIENLPEVAMDQKETSRLIKEILDSLSDEQRAVVGMFYYEQLSVKEIAEILNVSENTVKSRLNYARKKIEDRVNKLEKEQGIRLHSLAPIPFLLWLFRSQDVHAAEIPSMEVLFTLQNECVKYSSQPAKPKTNPPKSSQTGMEEGVNTASTGEKIGAETAKTAAGMAGKGLATKIVVGVLAVALIGGGVAVASRVMDKKEPVQQVEEVQTEPESETQKEEQTEETVPTITTKNFEGYYTSGDTTLAITITPIDDTTANILLDNISPNGANAFNQEGTATLEGEVLTMDMQTSEGDITTFTLSGSDLIVEATEHYQARANTYISGTYTLDGNSGSSETSSNVNLSEFVGEYMNGQDWNAGILTITENNSSSVYVRLQSFKNRSDMELSTAFEGVAYPSNGGLSIKVAGEDVMLVKGTMGLNLIVPESVKNGLGYDSYLYENEYLSIAPVEGYSAQNGNVDLYSYNGYSYYEGDQIKFRLDTADGNMVLTMWAQSGSPEYYEKYYQMDLSTADISGNTYTIYHATESGQNVRSLISIEFIFGDTITMNIQSDESMMAGGSSDNLMTGTYILSK